MTGTDDNISREEGPVDNPFEEAKNVEYGQQEETESDFVSESVSTFSYQPRTEEEVQENIY